MHLQIAKNRARQRVSRRGSMMLEVIVSAALLATLLIVINQILVRLHAHTALVDRHLVAQQTLENLLEEFSSRDWAEIESASINALKLPAVASSKLSQAVLEGEVVEEAEPVVAKRITMRLRWQSVSGIERRPLTLTTWVYQRVEANQ